MHSSLSRLWAAGTLVTLAFGSVMCAPPPLGGPGSDGSSTGSTVATGGGGGDGASTGSGGDVITVKPPDVTNPCEQPDAPAECELVAPPACGDGEINLDPPEDCDDGNGLPGDGCSGVCTVEPYYECPTPGAPCVTTIICGDGEIGPGEACDDGNQNSGDGCADNCRQVEKGFSCRTAGALCVRVFVCGDGIVDPSEGCDDGNGKLGDGCDDRCRMENGFKCDGNPSSCTETTCGDGKQEGAESCDDSNTVPFDGCSPTCQAEPDCETGKACTTTCGDGIMLNGEECDDGNSRDGDGCSSACKQEPGFNCTQPEPCDGPDCTLKLPIVYRDFAANHSDFGVSCATIERGIPKAMLTAQGKPELSAVSYDDACIATAASYADWYTDVPTNKQLVSDIVLYANGEGGYVNRYGDNGEQWVTTLNTGSEQGGYGTNAATCAAMCAQRAGERLQCTNTCRSDHDKVDQANRSLQQAEDQLTQAQNQNPPDDAQIAILETEIADLETQITALETAATKCDDDCQTQLADQTATCTDLCGPCSFSNDGSQWCIGGEVVALDGNPLFFPVPDLWNTPADMSVAEIPEEVYGGGWSADPTGIKRNFYFTSEIAYWFEYKQGMTAELSFTGDDDMWVFVNGHLAVDLGGLHVPVEGRFTLNANGTINQIHGLGGTANRNTPGTSTVADFGLVPGNVYEVKVFQAERKKTGSTYKLTLSGFNAGASDCMTDCGDGDRGPGEECDDGEANNLGGYNQCTADCMMGPHCGDGIKQDEEACDYGEGKNTGEYGGCSPTCELGPYCGDGFVSDGEECDDKVNDGGYGECAPGCKLGPVCGDGGLEPAYEECDDGNSFDKDGCSGACKVEMIIR